MQSEQKRNWDIAYLIRKLNAELKGKDRILIKSQEKRQLICKLSRLLYSYKKTNCQLCSAKEELVIHHKVFAYPIQDSDLRILCDRCHRTELQKLN